MPELPAKAAPALDDVAFDDDAAAETRADNRGDGGCCLARAEDREVPPERARVADAEWTKLVDPRALKTPVLLAGPGVSSPTTTTCSRSIPAFATAIARPSAICWRQISGPSLDRAGCSQSPSISQRSSLSTNV